MQSCFIIYFIIYLANAICIVNDDTETYIHQFLDQINLTNDTKIHLSFDSQNETQCLLIKEIHYTFLVRNAHLNISYIDIINSLCVDSCSFIKKDINLMTKSYAIDFEILISDTTELFYNVTIVYQIADDIPEPVSANDISEPEYDPLGGGAVIGIAVGSAYAGFLLFSFVFAFIIFSGMKKEAMDNLEETNNNSPVSNIESVEVSNIPS